MSRKFALIIGNTEYVDSGLAQLTAPGKDAEDFARVLESKEICGFDDVKISINEPSSSVIEAIDEFYDQKKPDDMLVLYFSGHGVKDESGSLYLAFKNTIRSRLRSTAIKSDYIRDAMDQSRSKRQVLILDCCNSGAFPQGTKAETGGTMGMTQAFQGYGRFVLTASDSTQFAWEGDKVIGETNNSLFTHFLVKGLEGEADSDGDGKITVDELYDYAYGQVSKVTPKQTPTKSSSKQEGEIILRQNMRIEDIKPVPLPTPLLDSIENPFSDVRLGAVQQLTKLLNSKNLGLARSAKEALERVVENDDSRQVSRAAFQALETIRLAEQAALQKAEEARLEAEKEEAEQLAKLKVEEERIAKARIEAERLAAEKAESDRLAKQKAEEERIAKAKIEAERLAAEKAESDRLVKQKAEEERISKAKIEAERLAAEKAEAERKAKQKAEQERLVKAKIESDHLIPEKAENERVSREGTKVHQETTTKTPETKKKPAKSAWITFAVIGGGFIALALCGFAATRLFSTLLGSGAVMLPAIEIPATNIPADGGKPATTIPDTPTQKILVNLGDVAVYQVSFSPDGKLVASTSQTGGAKLWDVSNGNLVQDFKEEFCDHFAFSPDGHTLAISCIGYIQLRRVDDGTLIFTIQDAPANIYCVAFSPDGQTVALGSTEGVLQLWRVSDGTLVKTFSGHTGRVKSVTFSPDGKMLASGSEDGTARLWRISNGSLIQTLEDQNNQIESVAFSPDGQMLASGSYSTNIMVWRVSDGALIKSFSEPSIVWSVAFSPDGQTIASGTSGFRLLQISDGALIKSFEGHTSMVSSVGFSPDGKLIVSGSYDGTIRLWSVPP